MSKLTPYQRKLQADYQRRQQPPAGRDWGNGLLLGALLAVVMLFLWWLQ